ncbi:MAG: hypothetical protein V7785_08820 [Bermanella sp.]
MLRWGMILLFMPSVVLVTLYMIEAQNVARCVQTGGSWDFVRAVCDMKGEHEFSSYMTRHGSWVNWAMLVSIVGLVMGTWGMITKGMSTPKDEA